MLNLVVFIVLSLNSVNDLIGRSIESFGDELGDHVDQQNHNNQHSGGAISLVPFFNGEQLCGQFVQVNGQGASRIEQRIWNTRHHTRG